MLMCTYLNVKLCIFEIQTFVSQRCIILRLNMYMRVRLCSYFGKGIILVKGFNTKTRPSGVMSRLRTCLCTNIVLGAVHF